MVKIKFQKLHFMFADGTFQRIITKRRKDSIPPLIKTAQDGMFLFRNDFMELLICFAVAGIKAAIADHFKMFLRDMPDQPFDEIYNRNRFLYIFIIFMSIVMEGNHSTILFVNPGSGDDRTSKIATNIFNDSIRVTFIGFCIHVKAFRVFFITFCFALFERFANFSIHFIKKSCAEGIPQIGIIKMVDVAPESIITVSTF